MTLNVDKALPVILVSFTKLTSKFCLTETTIFCSQETTWQVKFWIQMNFSGSRSQLESKQDCHVDSSDSDCMFESTNDDDESQSSSTTRYSTSDEILPPFS